MFKDDQFKGQTFVIKIGSAALRQENGLPDERLLTSIASNIAAAKRAGAFVVLVSSGALSTGRAWSRIKGRGDECDHVLASMGQAILMGCYSRILEKQNLSAGQILVGQSDVESPHILRTRLAGYRRHRDVLPVVNENDPMADPAERKLFRDNDELAAYLSVMLGATRLIILTIPCDPQPGLGRGGMETKIAAALLARRHNAIVHIAHSRESNVIADILNGGTGGTQTFAETSQLVERAMEMDKHLTGKRPYAKHSL